jgi:activating signal cointegrator 1
MSCGKVVCELEGEGPCFFCGAWVDREQGYDIAELYADRFDETGEKRSREEQAEGQDLIVKYNEALRHRDKLIEFDINSMKRLGVIDENADWYQLSKNAWINKD